MIFTLCLILAVLLLIGAAIDIRSRRLPNWLTASVALLYLPYVLASPVPVDWVSGLAVASLSFALGFTLFALNFMGGGDVKLISGLALWAGLDLIAPFLLMTGIAGGAMSIGVLLYRRFMDHPWVATFLPYFTVLVANRLGLPVPAQRAAQGVGAIDTDPTAGSIPYGVAIAAGGFAIISALLKL